jgi:hypothetical protein
MLWSALPSFCCPYVPGCSVQDERTQSNCGWDCHLPWFKRWLGAHIEDAQRSLGKPLLLSAVGKPYHEDKRNQLFSLVAQAVGEARRSAGADSVMAGVLFSTANVWNQTDWGGGSVYLDGSLPLQAPDRWAGPAGGLFLGWVAASRGC